MLGEISWNIQKIAIIGERAKKVKDWLTVGPKTGYQTAWFTSTEKAQAAAAELHQLLGSTESVQGCTNPDAVRGRPGGDHGTIWCSPGDARSA
jgi:hypothetical protein